MLSYGRARVTNVKNTAKSESTKEIKGKVEFGQHGV